MSVCALSFIEQLGLTDEEIAVLFDTDARPLEGQSLDELLCDMVSDPKGYLPTIRNEEAGSGELHDMIAAFEVLANGATVGLRVSRPLLLRFTAALGAKRFLILSGLAGSGKTKLAQAFARWLAPAAEEGQPEAYTVVPVGADWTGNDNILGYPDGLDPTRYVARPALDLIQRAARPENAEIPHFLILDEMNLSHVERYFADLSRSSNRARPPSFTVRSRMMTVTRSSAPARNHCSGSRPISLLLAR